MPDLSLRSTEAEIMDDLEYSGEMMDRTLYELEVINKWLGGNGVTLGGLKELVRQQDPGKEIRRRHQPRGLGPQGDPDRRPGLWTRGYVTTD